MNLIGRFHLPLRRIALWSAVPVSVGGLWALSYYLRQEELGPVPDISPTGNLQPSQLLLQQQELQQIDQPGLTSNPFTAKWSVCTTRGKDLFSQGRLEDAEKYFVESIELAKKGFGEDDAHVASSYNNLAELYRLKKEYNKAEPLYLQAVQLLQQAMGPEHPSVAYALHNLGGFYLLRKDYAKATECYEQALKIKGRGLGLNHPEYANTMFHLAKVMQLTGKMSEAENLIRQSIEILEDAGLGQTQNAVRRMVILAEILVQSNKLQEAENLQRKILHNLELTQGPEAANTIMALEALAYTLQLQENFDEAEELLKRCLESRQKRTSGNHIQIWASLFKLACVAMGRAGRLVTDSAPTAAMAEYDKAMTLLQQAIGIVERNWREAVLHSETAAESSYLLPLVQSLSMAGLIGVKRLELNGCNADDEDVKLGEQALRRCLLILSESDSSQVEVVKQKLKCTEQLGKMLNMIHGKKAAAEVDKLNKEASALRSVVVARKKKS